jgi:hypothetical protein
MILPITNEIVGRYLDPEQVHHLRSQTSTSPTNKKSLVNQIVHLSNYELYLLLESKINN